MSVTTGRRPGRPPGTNAADTRKRIINAARGVFSEVGYDAATFEEIAVRAGLTRPAINHYFHNKRILFREVVAETHGTVMETSAELARQQDSLLAQIGLFMALVIQADPDRTAARFMVTAVLESRRRPDLLEPEQDMVALTRDFITETVGDAIDRGELDAATDVKGLADMMLAVLWGMGLYAGFVGTPEELLGAGEQLRRLLMGQLWNLAS